LADFGHQAAKVVEAQRAVRDQRVDDCRLPLARDDPHDHLDSLDRIVWVCGARLSHGGICPPTILPTLSGSTHTRLPVCSFLTTYRRLFSLAGENVRRLTQAYRG